MKIRKLTLQFGNNEAVRYDFKLNGVQNHISGLRFDGDALNTHHITDSEAIEKIKALDGVLTQMEPFPYYCDKQEWVDL